MLEEKKIRELSESLVRSSKAENIDYVGISKCAEELLNLVFGDKYDIPINVEKIANELVITLWYPDLNEFNKEQIPIYSTVQKHTNRINKEISWALRIDKFANFRWQGFYVAKGIAYFLLEYDNKMANMMCRNELILEVKREELICDVFARFLLLPVSIVISEYIQEKQIVLKHNANADFCEHLTNKSGMPEIEVSKAWYEIQLMYMLTEK